MIESQVLKYYEWDDIEKFLCDKLGIDEKHFRDYHLSPIHNGKTKNKYWDFWHVWLSINYDDVVNDTYACVWFEMIIDNLQSKKFINEYGEWIIALVEPLKELEKIVGEDHIYIHYSW